MPGFKTSPNGDAEKKRLAERKRVDAFMTKKSDEMKKDRVVKKKAPSKAEIEKAKLRKRQTSRSKSFGFRKLLSALGVK